VCAEAVPLLSQLHDPTGRHATAQQPNYMQAAPAACEQQESHRNAQSRQKTVLTPQTGRFPSTLLLNPNTLARAQSSFTAQHSRQLLREAGCTRQLPTCMRYKLLRHARQQATHCKWLTPPNLLQSYSLHHTALPAHWSTRAQPVTKLACRCAAAPAADTTLESTQLPCCTTPRTRAQFQ
jgi:hypothetical protein